MSDQPRTEFTIDGTPILWAVGDWVPVERRGPGLVGRLPDIEDDEPRPCACSTYKRYFLRPWEFADPSPFPRFSIWRGWLHRRR